MKIVKLLFALCTLAGLFVCTDPENPFDISDPNYQKTTFDIVVDSTGLARDTIVITTADSLKLGIQSKYLNRVDSIRVDYDLKSITDSLKIIPISSVVPSTDLNFAYLQLPKNFDEAKTYMVEVYLYTLNGDNVADTIYVVVNGVPPVIISLPRDTAVEETDTAYFSVNASGTKGFTYQWYKTDSPVKPGVVLKDENSIIYTDNFVEMEDSGYYYCVVTNSYGSATSKPSKLSVMPQKIDPNWPFVLFAQDTLTFNESVKAAVIPVVLSKPAEKEIRVGIVFLASSSAKPDSDYVISARDVVFPVNTKNANLTIEIKDDNLGEIAEEIILQIGTIRNAQPGTTRLQNHCIITDDDVADSTWPELFFLTDKGEGPEGQNVVIPIALATKNNWEREVKVKVKILGGSPEDYKFTDTVVTFAVNEKQKNITLLVPRDQVSENDEIIKLGLENPYNAVLSKTQATVYQYTIKDINTSIINFESLEMTGAEKDTSPVYDSIKVVLSTPSINEVTVQYAIDSSISTATNQGVDYLLTGDGMLKFPPNVQVAWIPIVISGDKLAEGEEIIGIKLLNPTGGASLAPSAPSFRYIIGDNEVVSISFRNARTTIKESVGDFNVAVYLSGQVIDTVQVDYRISGTAQGTDADYQFKNGGLRKVTFLPGQTEGAIEMVVFDDKYNEPEESFVLKLENVKGNAHLGLIDTHKVVIQDDDSPFFTFDRATATISEGIGTFNIAVGVSNPSQFPVRVRCVLDPIATNAQSADFALPLSDTVTIKANDTIAYFPVTITNDLINENPQQVALRLLQVENDAVPGANTSITLTINDDDNVPTVAFLKDSLFVSEADGQLIIPVLVTGQSEKSMKISYRSGQMSAGCDTVDFAISGNGVLDFTSGPQQNIIVSIKNDILPDEPLDNFKLDLYNPENLTLGTIGSELITIRDNDYQLSIGSTGDSGTVTPAGFTVVQRGDSLLAVGRATAHHHIVTWTASTGLTISDPSNDTLIVRNIQCSGTVTALFALDTHEVVISANEYGSIVPSGTVKAGWGKTILPGTLTPLSGFHFSHWTLAGAVAATGGNTNPTSTFLVSGNGTIKAEFAIDDHALQIRANDTAMGTVSPTRIEMTFGSDTTINATAKPHAHFIKWDAPAALLASIESKTAPTTRVNDISVTGTIIAVFGWDSSSIAISTSNSSMGSVDPVGNLVKSYVDTVILNATPLTGYRFTGWNITSGTGNGVIDIPTAQTTVLRKVTGDIAVQGVFAVNKYKIQLQTPDSGGAATTTNPALTADSLLNFGARLILTANPLTGWEFDHWVGGAADGHTKNPDTITVGTANQYKAMYKRKMYTLTATATSAEGFVSGLAPVRFPHGIRTKFTITVTPSNADQYQFSNTWYPVSGSPVCDTGNYITLTANSEIRAIFNKRTYAIVLTQPTQGGVISSVPSTGTLVEFGSNITLAATPGPGYHFGAWIGGAANGLNTNPLIVAGSASNQFSAAFELNTYTLTLTVDPTLGSLSISSIADFQHGIAKPFSVIVTNKKPDSCTFNNTWTVINGTAVVDPVAGTAKLSSNATIQANFAPKLSTIALTQSTGGTISSNPSNGTTVGYGSDITLTATPGTGYHFVRWVGGTADGLTTNPVTVKAGTSNSFSAVFALNSYTLTLEVDPLAGSLSTSSIGGFEYGVSKAFSVTVTNKKPDSCTFNNTWTVTNGTAVIDPVAGTAKLSSNATIKANFSIKSYNLTLAQPSQGGTIESTPASGSSYLYGSSLALRAFPLPGYHFVNWTGGNAQGATTYPLTTTIGTNNNISAVFAPDRFTLSLTQPTNGGTITTSPAPGTDGKYDYGTNVTLTVNLVTGWAFSSWTGITGGNPRTIQITGNIAVGANVAPIGVPAHVICVKQDAPQNGGGALGSSWVDAYTNLHDALSAAVSGDAIWVSQGTYIVSSSDVSVTYKMKSGVSVYGGFVGIESALTSRNWINNGTILNGVCGTNKSDTIFVIQSGAILDGFRISDGGRYGGYARGASKIRNCIFSNNSSKTPAGGTALMMNTSGCAVSGCVFTGNVGTNGSAVLIYTGMSDDSIVNCVITNNRGPAIYNNATSAVLLKSSVVDNTNPNTTPGGIYNTGTLRIESSILWGNTNSSSPQASTQISATQYVDYCCIQDCNIAGRGVGSKVEGWWQATNTDVSPAFENTTLPADDRSWYTLTSNTVPPFVPGNPSGCYNASYISISSYGNDIRGMARSIPCEIGAYERY